MANIYMLMSLYVSVFGDCGQFYTRYNLLPNIIFLVLYLMFCEKIQYHSRYPYMFFSFSFVSLSLPRKPIVGLDIHTSSINFYV